jgi:hypothetical protein
MPSLLNRLPEDVLRLIWKKVYAYSMEELNNFEDKYKADRVYIYKRPNALCSKNEYLIITHTCSLDNGRSTWYKVEAVYPKFDGSRNAHFLPFYQLILHLKHHPTGFHDNGLRIEMRHRDEDEEEE